MASRPRLSRLAPGDEERGLWSRIPPGALALLFYTDDVVWHESIYLWGDNMDTIVIATPDYDVYDEFVFRHYGQGAIRIIAELPGDVRPMLGARMHRFAEQPSAEELRQFIRRGRSIAEAACRKKGIPVSAYSHVVSPEGVSVPIQGFSTSAPPFRSWATERPLPPRPPLEGPFGPSAGWRGLGLG